MKSLGSHTDLDVYKESIELVVQLYQLSKEYPSDEIYGLVGQIKRASVSIPANIAEGAARQSTKEYIKFLYISLGSASEVETLLEISSRLNIIGENAEVNEKLLYIKKMLLNLIKALKKKL